jgi:hypothetical protein
LSKNKSDIFLMLLTCTKGHGFRSSFREWAGNIPNFRREVIETANQWERQELFLGRRLFGIRRLGMCLAGMTA